MGKQALLKSEISKIKKLRETGHSLPEIQSILNRGYGTVYRYIKGVSILPEYKEIWKVKRGGSRSKSLKEWEYSRLQASNLLNDFNSRDKMLILACLYWGEGNKTELNLVNSDPHLVRVVISCLKEFGIKDKEIKIGLRLFEDISEVDAIDFWLKFLGLPKGSITFFEIKKGKKVGKLKYGMCRVRVKKGGKYFKLIMSMIDLIRKGI